MILSHIVRHCRWKVRGARDKTHVLPLLTGHLPLRDRSFAAEGVEGTVQ